MRTLTELPNLEPETLLTPSEIGDHLGVTRRTVQRWVNDNKFPNSKRVRSGSIIPWGDVLNYVTTKED